MPIITKLYQAAGGAGGMPGMHASSCFNVVILLVHVPFCYPSVYPHVIWLYGRKCTRKFEIVVDVTLVLCV